MATQAYHDDGIIFYIPETGEPEEHPYWRVFMRIAVTADRMEETRHPAAEHIACAAFSDEDDQMLGVQMPDPVLADGSPREEVLLGLRTILSEEEIGDLMVQFSQGKRQVAAGELTENTHN